MGIGSLATFRAHEGRLRGDALRDHFTGLLRPARDVLNRPVGPGPASPAGVARCGFAGSDPACRPSGRSPPGSRKNSNCRYGPPPFSG